MSNNWDDYDPAPIEVFHGEAMEAFHKGAQFPVNEVTVNGIRFVNGIEFNRLLAEFKTKIMKHYGITSNPTLKKTRCKDCGVETKPGAGSARCPECWEDRCG